jgi:hypothetical protein
MLELLSRDLRQLRAAWLKRLNRQIEHRPTLSNAGTYA